MHGGILRKIVARVLLVDVADDIEVTGNVDEFVGFGEIPRSEAEDDDEEQRKPVVGRLE